MNESLEERLSQIEDRLDGLEQEIADKIYETGRDDPQSFQNNFDDIVKIFRKHEIAIQENRDAINEIIDYIQKRDKVTVTKVLTGLASLRSLLGIP